MTDDVWDSPEAKLCITFYDSHSLKRIQFGDIGYLEYCELCGTGKWTRAKKEPSHPSVKLEVIK